MIFIVKFSGKNRIQKKIYKECKEHDYLTISDFFFKTRDNGYSKIDNLIIGNKYIYLVNIIPYSGEAKINSQDQKWRIILFNKLTPIDNPFIRSEKIKEIMYNRITGLEKKDIKCIACFAKTCTFNEYEKSDNQFVLSENDIIKFIEKYERKSNDDIIDPKEAERYIQFFYRKGIENDEIVKDSKKNGSGKV